MTPNYRICLALAVFLAACVARADSTFTYGGHSYTIITTPATWTAARAVVGGRGEHLAFIDSAAENTAIFNALVAAAVTTTAPDGGGARYAWIGGTDDPTAVTAASEGNFYWSDGTRFWSGGLTGSAYGGRYANFGTVNSKEPDNWNTQNFIAMGVTAWPNGAAAQWNDIAGANSLVYVSESVPEPGTFVLLGAGALVLVFSRVGTGRRDNSVCRVDCRKGRRLQEPVNPRFS
jgi:hypothetical protein